MKKIISVVLAMFMVFSLASVFSISTKAATHSGTCGDSLTWSLDTVTGELSIDGTGNMTTYFNYKTPWYLYVNSIKSVKMGANVKSISNGAFFLCQNLVSVEIGNGVTSIGEEAFSNCSNLKSITIPASVTSIGSYAFYLCGMTFITIPSSVTSIGESAFGLGVDRTPISGFSVFGYSGTAAETYAKNNNITFVPSYGPIGQDIYSDISGCSSGVKAAIKEMSKLGIIGGYDDRTFRPTEGCTRQQMVIMMWRLCGKPEPKSLNSALKFTDTASLTSGSKKAIAWAVEQGITSGFSDGTFRPTDYVTRQQTVIFLWRLEGKPSATSTASFTDTGSCSAGAMKAINWAASTGISKGIANGNGTYRFAPNDYCQRQQIVTFLYRIV